MKTAKLLISVIMVAGICMLTAGTASAHGHVSWGFDFMLGPWFGPGYYPPYSPGVAYANPYYPYAYPYNYTNVVVEGPVIVEKPPVVITQPAAPVQIYRAPAVQTSDKFADVRMKKAELLKQLASTDKAEKMKAISGLGGLSYDDEVMAKLTEILLKDPDADLRKEVIKAFAAVKNQKVIFTLEGVRVSDDNKEVRQAANECISALQTASSANPNPPPIASPPTTPPPLSQPAPMVVTPAPVYVPEYYVWDGYEYVGWCGGQYVYSSPGGWVICDSIVLGRFHGWERSHRNWRRDTIRYHGHDPHR